MFWWGVWDVPLSLLGVPRRPRLVKATREGSYTHHEGIDQRTRECREILEKEREIKAKLAFFSGRAFLWSNLKLFEIG